MRLWSLHPGYLDARGLVALWREALLARNVLAGQTRGYRHHPQLRRFRAHPDPAAAIDAYLHGILLEADCRGYRFDRSKAGASAGGIMLAVTSGQLRFEWSHLLKKLESRSPGRVPAIDGLPRPHPIFRVVSGPAAGWERGAD